MNPPAKEHILVVDDNEDLLEAYTDLLDTLGYKVSSALNGQIAWEMMQKSTFEIVLTDVKMPVMDGIQLLKKTRERDKLSPPVIVTSGFSDQPADILLNMGANGFLPKPVATEMVREVLSRAPLKIEERWKIPWPTKPAAQIERKFASLESMITSGEVRFGNGGFFLKDDGAPSPQIQRPIQFKFTLDSGPSVNGMGVVQWIHNADSLDRKAGVGIEIRSLSDECREAVCKWIHQQKFEAFIPIQ